MKRSRLMKFVFVLVAAIALSGCAVQMTQADRLANAKPFPETPLDSD